MVGSIPAVTVQSVPCLLACVPATQVTLQSDFIHVSSFLAVKQLNSQMLHMSEEVSVFVSLSLSLCLVSPSFPISSIITISISVAFVLMTVAIPSLRLSPVRITIVTLSPRTLESASMRSLEAPEPAL